MAILASTNFGIKCLLISLVERRANKSITDSSESGKISANQMDIILEQLQMQTTRTSTAKNYYSIWKKFN